MIALFILTSFMILLVGSICLFKLAVKKGMKPAKAVVLQVCSFIALFVIGFSATAMSTSAASNDASTNDVDSSASVTRQKEKSDKEWDSIAMAVAIGAASIGTGIAVAAAAPAAIGAVSEDPKSFGKSIVFVGMAEGVAVFALLVAVLIKFL